MLMGDWRAAVTHGAIAGLKWYDRRLGEAVIQSGRSMSGTNIARDLFIRGATVVDTVVSSGSLCSAADFEVFEGREAVGWPVYTVSRHGSVRCRPMRVADASPASGNS